MVKGDNELEVCPRKQATTRSKPWHGRRKVFRCVDERSLIRG
jgi:hypothetical protein